MVQTYETVFTSPLDHIFANTSLTPLSQDASGALLSTEVVEVLRLWDTDLNEWVADSPTLVRLLSQDLLIPPLTTHMTRMYAGAIDTSASFFLSFSSGDQHLVLWRSDTCFSAFYGDAFVEIVSLL